MPQKRDCSNKNGTFGNSDISLYCLFSRISVKLLAIKCQKELCLKESYAKIGELSKTLETNKIFLLNIHFGGLETALQQY